MVIALTTDTSNRNKGFQSAGAAVLWRDWQESRGRFFCALALLTSIVIYAVVTGPGYIERRNALAPDKPELYTAYVWGGLFHYALQGLWVLAVLIITLGGLRRESATGRAQFTLGFPITRLHLFLVRAGVACAESFLLGLIPALLIPALSPFVGESYPLTQALAFGTLMSAAGLAIIALGLLLSEIFEGEFTAPVVGLCGLTAIFLSYKAGTLHAWNVFDVMSATASIDPVTRLFNGAAPWAGLAVCLLASFALFVAAGVTIRTRDL